MGRESENTLWKIGSSLAKATLVPTVTGNTRGMKVLFSWVMLRPRRGGGLGVEPSARFSHTTDPPGPRLPPPLTCPLTATSGWTGIAGAGVALAVSLPWAGRGLDFLDGQTGAALAGAGARFGGQRA